jgi:hypothetical protein
VALDAQLVSYFQTTIGNTEDTYGLGPTVSQPAPNVMVHKLECYTSDPDAVFLVVVERISGWSSVSSGINELARWLRQSETDRHYTAVQFTTPSVAHRLGKHIFSQSAPLVVDFPQPIECMKDAESDTDHYFALAFTRLDASGGANVYANVYWTEF